MKVQEVLGEKDVLGREEVLEEDIELEDKNILDVEEEFCNEEIDI